MVYKHEKVDTSEMIPAKIYVGTGEYGCNRYALHWHEHLEFDLVLNGVIRGSVNDKRTEVRKNGIFFANSGDLHETDAEDIQAITVLLSYNLITDAFPEADKFYFDFSEDEAAAERIRRCIIKCGELHTAKSPFYELELSVTLRELCLILLKECRKPRPPEYYSHQYRTNIDHIKKAISYMEENYSEDVTLNDVAKAVGLTPTYFSRLFKSASSDTYYSFLTKLRLFHAHMNVIDSDMPITEIALQNGFPNAKSFIEAFKRVYQATPMMYRKKTKR